MIKRAKKLNVYKNVKFFGAVTHENIHKFLLNSDVFLLSSDYEGFGISVIEAMSVGLPVVVNDIESMRIIIRNGVNGYIVNFDDFNKTAKIIINLLKDRKLATKIGNASRTYSKKYDWYNVVSSVEKIYKN
mgnify:FL=1